MLGGLTSDLGILPERFSVLKNKANEGPVGFKKGLRGEEQWWDRKRPKEIGPRKGLRRDEQYWDRKRPRGCLENRKRPKESGPRKGHREEEYMYWKDMKSPKKRGPKKGLFE